MSKSKWHIRSMVLRALSSMIVGAFALGGAGCEAPPEPEESEATDTRAQAVVWTPVDSSWKLTFDDEFNGSSLDASKWTANWLGSASAITPPVGSGELQAYDPAQVTVSGGNLVLSAINKPVTVNGKSYQYRSGMAQTHGKFNQAYGYFEARIRLSGSNGVISNWPAWWTDGESWPQDGEIDIMEGLSGKAGWHYHSPSGGPGSVSSADFTGWHVFGALWEPGAVTFYYDGKQMAKLTNDIRTAPNYLILNLAVGSYGGPVVIPDQMLVDYVHVYSKSASAVAVTPQAGYGGPGATGDGSTPPPPTTPPPTSGTNLVGNPGFEAGLASWTHYGVSRVDTTQPRSGTSAAYLEKSAAFEQVITGLKPNTSYSLQAWLKASTTQSSIAIGAKDFGGTQAATSSSSTSWQSTGTTFRTGTSNTSAKIFVYGNAGSGRADDVTLTAL